METSICRCCASEGAFKDVKSTYHWMGEEEIYADMLKECFDINLFQPEGAEDSGICEVCITQLRNAVNFKKQVLHTEEQFKKQLQSGKMFKPSIVKVEVPMEHHDSDDDDHASAEDGYSEPDFEIPIKIEDTEETEKRPKSKKRAAPVKKSTSTRAKKAKIEEGEPSTKRLQRHVNIKIEKKDGKRKLLKRKQRNVATKPIPISKKPIDNHKSNELEKHRSNIRIILQSTNATPIRCRGGIGYACSFCGSEYPEPLDLKKHTIEEHDDKTKLKFMSGKMMFSYLVKLDITNLCCNICHAKINSLEKLTEHLIQIHEKPLFTDINNHIMPFKFDDEVLTCIYCQNIFNKFKNLQQHMNVHRRNYVCETCDAGFVNRHILACHTEAHKTGTFKCDLCPKVFDTHRKKKSHEKSVHIHANLLSKCGYCNQKFTNFRKRDLHLVKVHGVHMKVIKCHACDKTFDNKSSLTIHTKRDHLMERRHLCSLCDMRFFGSNELKLHMVKHTGIREFKCDVCLKSYGRKKTLTEHMRIHNDDRRFKCEHCGQAFVQKCSWKGHMRSRHGELV